MNISFLQENARHALSYVQKAIPSRPSLPILSSILVEVKSASITLSATDLYFAVRTTFPAKSNEAGTFAIPGKQLRDTIFSLPAGSITMEKLDSAVKITSSAGAASLQCQESDEFPPFPQISGPTIEIPLEVINQIVTQVAQSASTDQSRPILTSILLRQKDTSLTAVATDGFRLAVQEITSGMKLSDDIGELLLPAKVLTEVAGVATQLEVENIIITVSREMKQLHFQLGEVEMYGRMIEGDFPPFEQIIPSSFETLITLESDALADQVRRAMIFSKDSSSIIQIKYSPEELRVMASSASVGSFEGVVEGATVEGGKGDIAFNARYVLDFLQLYKQQQIVMKITDSLKPALFSSPDNPQSTFVIMPFRLNQ